MTTKFRVIQKHIMAENLMANKKLQESRKKANEKEKIYQIKKITQQYRPPQKYYTSAGAQLAISDPTDLIL